MKKYSRMIVDIIMLALSLYLMYYHPGMGLRLHTLLGIVLCVLFVLHHFLNIRWYAVLFKGQYAAHGNPERIFHDGADV